MIIEKSVIVRLGPKADSPRMIVYDDGKVRVLGVDSDRREEDWDWSGLKAIRDCITAAIEASRELSRDFAQKTQETQETQEEK